MPAECGEGRSSDFFNNVVNGFHSADIFAQEVEGSIRSGFCDAALGHVTRSVAQQIINTSGWASNSSMTAAFVDLQLMNLSRDGNTPPLIDVLRSSSNYLYFEFA